MVYCFNDNDIKKGDIFFVTISGEIVKGVVFNSAVNTIVGNYYKYNDVLYRCIKVNAGAFNSSNFDVVQRGYMSSCDISNMMSALELKINNDKIISKLGEYHFRRTDIKEIEVMSDMNTSISIFGES